MKSDIGFITSKALPGIVWEFYKKRNEKCNLETNYQKYKQNSLLGDNTMNMWNRLSKGLPYPQLISYGHEMWFYIMMKFNLWKVCCLKLDCKIMWEKVVPRNIWRNKNWLAIFFKNSKLVL